MAHPAAGVDNDPPCWERRVRAPHLLSFSLLGSPVAWARDVPDAGVILASLGRRVEVYAFDGRRSDRLQQVSDRPSGTLGCGISPDGTVAYWFDDEQGSELGRWVRHPLDGSAETTLLSELPPAYGSGGFAPVGSGVVVGRLLDDGFELAVTGPHGTRVPYRASEPAFLEAVSRDESRALIGFAPGGDWLHLGVRVIDLSDGSVVAELAMAGHRVEAGGFDPMDAGRVLVSYEPRERVVSFVWDLATGATTPLRTGLAGDVFAHWSCDDSALVLLAASDARHSVHRLALASGDVTRLDVPAGKVAALSPRPDGSVHVLTSSSDRPVELLRVGESVTSVITLPGDLPPPTVVARDVWADGPGGRVHGLVLRPDGAAGPRPAVVAVHGGPTGQDYDSWNDTVAALVDEGYVVVRVNYRGSTGYGAAWRDALHRRLGFIELEDVTAVRAALEREGQVDPRRVSVMGASWGGYLTLMALGTQPQRWRSGVALVPLADWFTNAEDAPGFMQAYDRSLFGVSITEDPDVYRASSPITYVDDVVAPVFITAGEHDPRCPVRQVDTYVAALRRRGHDVRYDRLEAGHAMPDIEMKVTELRGVLEFLRATNPA